jgi:hypothetical protein
VSAEAANATASSPTIAAKPRLSLIIIPRYKID